MNDLELVAFLHALKTWRHYLHGKIFELHTDHMSLKYLFDQPILNARKDRWLKFLSEFNLEIKHVRGKKTKLLMLLARNIM